MYCHTQVDYNISSPEKNLNSLPLHLKKKPIWCCPFLLRCILIILDGNSEIGSQGRSNLGYLICLRHLFGPRAVKNLVFFFYKKTCFLHAGARCSELPSYVITEFSALSVNTRYRTILKENLNTSYKTQ